MMTDARQITVGKIRTRNGKTITPKQYVAMAQRPGVDEPCYHGHFGCAAWEDGPCSDEVASSIECQGHEPGSNQPVGVTVYCDGACRRVAVAR